MKGVCTWIYNRFYVEGEQDLRPFYTSIPNGNVLFADYSQALQVKNWPLCFKLGQS